MLESLCSLTVVQGFLTALDTSVPLAAVGPLYSIRNWPRALCTVIVHCGDLWQQVRERTKMALLRPGELVFTHAANARSQDAQRT
jgi:hypothetical protein